MRPRDKLRHLERAAEEELISIAQQHGTVARFPRSAHRKGFLNPVDRIGAGEDAPLRHPLLGATRNSSDPRWRKSYLSDIDYDGSTAVVEDLSE